MSNPLEARVFAAPVQEIRMLKRFKVLAALAGALLTAVTGSAGAQAQSRSELLYSTHCISCHTSEIHWRDNKAATE